MSDNALHPRERFTQVGRAEIEPRLRQAMRDGALSSGWIIAGPKGAGKATLAYRIARGLLDPGALKDDETFDTETSSQGVNLIANAAHPDLYALEREWDEKKNRYRAEISVDSVRELISFMNRTAAYAGFRVAIVDTADDLNRNGANALLKMLEEPPKNSVVFLLSSTPGRLLATIRSRCKSINLRPVETNAISELIMKETGANAKDAVAIANHARGRPGYALSLALEDGGAAINLAHDFLRAAVANDSPARVISALSGKSGDQYWPIFAETVLGGLADAARAEARGNSVDGPLRGIRADRLIDGWRALNDVAGRGSALNLDRGQILHAMSYDLRAALQQGV